MFAIDRSQFETLDKAREQRYRDDLLRYFREHHPDHTAARGDSELAGIIAESLDDARAYGVVSGAALLRYVSLAVLVARDFAAQPAVRQFFAAPGVDPDYKVELLADLLIAKLDRA